MILLPKHYIQDTTGAILIDDYSGIITTSYNLYDGITGIIGSLQEYNGMLQFVPVTDPGPATSTGNIVVPVEVTLAELNTDYQGKLVKVKNVVISATGNFEVSKTYTISDITGSGVIRTQYADLDYLGKPIPTTLQNLTGVVLQYQTTTQLIPRSLTDFEDASLTQYRSKISGNWTDAGTWQKLVGSEWIDATNAPEGFSDYITIKASDTVTVNDTLRIGSGATVKVDGYLKNIASIISNGTFVFSNGSIYEHAIDKDAIPIATWEEGATCLITGIAGTSAPTGLNQEFYHFTWNCPSQSGNLNFNANLTTIKGDFNVIVFLASVDIAHSLAPASCFTIRLTRRASFLKLLTRGVTSVCIVMAVSMASVAARSAARCRFVSCSCFVMVSPLSPGAPPVAVGNSRAAFRRYGSGRHSTVHPATSPPGHWPVTAQMAVAALR